MTYTTPTPASMATRMGVQIDVARATALIADAEQLCLDLVNPLPASAAAVVMSAAIRAYTNITGAAAETTGPDTVTHGPSSSPGVFLTKGERTTLKRAAGIGGAFSIDLIGPRTSPLDYWAQVAEDPFASVLQAGGGWLPGGADWSMS